MQINKNIFWVLIPIIITVIIYKPGLKNELVMWDDHKYILENTTLDTINWVNMSKETLGNFHPLTNTVNALIKKEYGFKSEYYHGFQLLVHCLNLILLYFLFWKILKPSKALDYLIITVGLVFYSTHPFKVEDISWASEAKDVTSTLFYLIGVIVFLKENKNIKDYILILILFAVGMLFKSMVITLPVVLFILERFFIDNKEKTKKWFWILCSVMMLYFISITLKYQGTSKEMIDTPIEERPLIALYGLGYYLIHFIIPGKLSIIHEWPSSYKTVDFIGYVFVGLSYLALCWYTYLKNQYKLFAAFVIFFVLLLPILQLVPIGRSIVSERYTYLAYAVLILLILSTKYFSKINYKVVLTILCIVSVINIKTTNDRIKVWKNTISLYNDLKEKQPNYYYSHLTIGYYYYGIGDAKNALSNFLVADSLFKNYKLKSREIIFDKEKLYTGLGISYAKIGDKRKAVNFLVKADNTKINPMSTLFNLYNGYMDLQMLDSARYLYQVYKETYHQGNKAVDDYLYGPATSTIH